MRRAFYSIKEAELLDVATDLFERSDGCSGTQPTLSRQYAHQAYRLGAHSRNLCHLIAKERIEGIRRRKQLEGGQSAAQRISQILDLIALGDTVRAGCRSVAGRAALALLAMLVVTVAASKSIDETSPDQRLAASSQPFTVRF